MVMITFLPEIHLACRNDANGIKPGRNSKMTDKCAAEFSKLRVLCKLICVRCMDYSYNSKGGSMSLLDKIAISVCTGKFSYKLDLFR